MTGDDATLPSGQASVPQATGGSPLGDDLSRALQQLWTTGKRARIEDFLPRVPADVQPQLLERLLRIEYELQSESGETMAVRDYRQQFPQYRDVIDSVMADLSTAGRGTDRTRPNHAST